MLVAAGGATCTSAITDACKPNDIHNAATGRRSRDGIAGSSGEPFTATWVLSGIYARKGMHALPGTFEPGRKPAALA
jgi:hypothetical protein